MSVVCGYDLDCYCDTPECDNTAEFGDATYVLTFKQAQRAGWIFRENNTKCYCPDCVAKGLHNKSKRTTRKPRQIESPMPDRLRQILPLDTPTVDVFELLRTMSKKDK